MQTELTDLELLKNYILLQSLHLLEICTSLKTYFNCNTITCKNYKHVGIPPSNSFLAPTTFISWHNYIASTIPAASSPFKRQSYTGVSAVTIKTLTSGSSVYLV